MAEHRAATAGLALGTMAVGVGLFFAGIFGAVAFWEFYLRKPEPDEPEPIPCPQAESSCAHSGGV